MTHKPSLRLTLRAEARCPACNVRLPHVLEPGERCQECGHLEVNIRDDYNEQLKRRLMP